MDTPILARSDLEALTGYVRASAQIRRLARRGWNFAVMVALVEVNRHLVGGKRAAPT
jgi:hypothetical protein